MKKIKFVDLFAGMGGLRIGLENACYNNDIDTECIVTSDLKKEAKIVLEKNFIHNTFVDDVQNIDEKELEEFDCLLAGFPCQPFSSAGLQRGFNDTRGTLFFDIARILNVKKPSFFVLENVANLETHDNGNTLSVIIKKLEEIGYYVTYKMLNSKDFGVAQDRKRIFIVGTLKQKIDLSKIKYKKEVTFDEIKEIIKIDEPSEFSRKLFKKFERENLYGKSIKDKRGGVNNIHSWEIDLKGKISKEECNLMNQILKKRRSKKWAAEIGIEWMDGMPLTIKQIKTFNDSVDIEKMCENLVSLGYLKLEHPKKKVLEDNGISYKRTYDHEKEKGYNIVAGKLSYEYSKLLNPTGITPTLVATDMHKIGVVEENGIRKLSINECKKLCGYPENYDFANLNDSQIYDLIGNTVVVNVVEEIVNCILKELKINQI